MILMIDNYDSFTFNLVQYLGELGAKVEVYRNDALTLAQIAALKPARIVISPGPCTPLEAGISVDLIKTFGQETPILGVCLGHQSIGAAYGADIVKAPSVMHGKTSEIHHDGSGVFKNIPNPFTATRYHSLVIDPPSLSSELVVNARTADGVIMGVRHRDYPVHGVQFHPESILTKCGKDLLQNFLSL